MAHNYYLGIDVSKGYADFIILDQKKNCVEKCFQIDDTFTGHNQFYKFLSDFFESNPDSHIYAAVESTGGYENNWYNNLNQWQANLPLSVARVNPYGVNYNGKATLARIVTDKQSAKNIADYMISHSEKVDYQHQDYFSSARRQWTFIKMLTKQKTQLLNQLESMLYIANPEILIHCKNGVRLWTLKLLLNYPTANCLSRARVGSISKIPYVSKSLAEEISKQAKQSIASSNDATTEEVIKAMVKQIISLRGLIVQQNKLLENSINLPQVELLKTFNGIGTYSAVGLMLEIVSVNRFKTSKQLASFFGIHPVFRESGDGLSGTKMSKKGRKEPRQILFNVARFAIVHNPLITEIYKNHLKKGMSKMAAIGAIMYKILRIVYGMLKNETPFNPEIDRKNREKFKKIIPKIKPETKRRYQPIDSKAPISRRQNIKRKEKEIIPK